MKAAHTVGRRKASVARVYLSEKKGKTAEILVNNRPYDQYFGTPVHRYKVTQCFELANKQGQYDVKANIFGGGITGQAEALRLGIARALCKLDPSVELPVSDEAEGAETTIKKVLRREGLLTRDARVVERKKYGRKKARKKRQFSKR